MRLVIKKCVAILLLVISLQLTSCEASSNGGAQDDTKPQASTQPVDNKTDPFVVSIDKIYDLYAT